MPLPFAGPDRLLAHYARTGDARSLGRLFDRTAPELLRVALWLVGDRHDAEDLLQRTFVAVMQSRERYDPARRAVPWMCGVLGNLARRLHEQRARTRREVPIEGAAERAGAGDPVRAASDAELRAAVARMRDALGAPYAEVLDLHLGEGLDANQIAERLSRPAGTVRTQIVRGLGLLKRHLPDGFVAGLLLVGTARAAVLDAAQAAVRQQVMHAAAAAQPAGAAAGTAALAIQIAGTTMGKKMLWLAPALLLAIGGGVLWWQQESAAAPVSPAPLAAEVEGGGRDVALREPVASAAQQRVAAMAVEALPEPDPDWATLVVRLKWEDDGSPAVGVGIRAQPEPGLPTRMRCGLTDETGAVTLRRLRPGRVVVDSHFSVPKWIDVEAGRVQTLDVSAPRGEAVEGIVLDAAERPVVGARIWLSDSGSVWRGFEVASTDAGGRFAVTARGGFIGARCAGYVPSRLRMLTPGHGPLTIRLMEAAGAVRGRVVDTQGQPVADALVAIGWPGGHVLGSTRDEHYTAPTRPRIVTDADGRFVCDGVAPGSTWVQAWAAGFGAANMTTLVEAGASAEVTVALAAGAVVEGVVRDTLGGAVANVGVGYGIRDYTFDSVETSTDAEGRFRLEDLWAGELPLTVRRAGREVARQVVTTIGGAVTTWNPVLDEGAELRGIVLAPDGSPVADLTVGVLPDNQAALDPETTTDAEGAFVLPGIRTVPLTLRIRGDCPLAERKLDAVPAGSHVIQLADREWPSASLRGCVRDADGAAMSATVWVHQWWWRTQPQQLTDERGEFGFERLTAGDYTVTVLAPGHGELRLPPLHLGAGESVRLPDVQLHPAGRVEFELRLPRAGAKLGVIDLVRDDGQSVTHITPEGDGASAVLPPGAYHALARFSGDVATTRFLITSGQTTRATMTFVQGQQVDLVLHPDADVRVERAHVLVRDGGGAVVAVADLVAQPECLDLGRTVVLVPGSYTVEARGVGVDLCGEVTFTVEPGQRATRIDVPLRKQ